MMEFLFEYTLNLLDFMFLVFFYSKLIEKKIVKSKCFLFIVVVAGFQYVLDMNFSLKGYKSIVDTVYIILILILYSKKLNAYNLLNAVMVNCIFIFCIVFINAVSIIFHIDIDRTLVFGWYRFVYSMIIKLIIIGMFHLLIKPLIAIKNNIDKPTAIYFTVAISVSTYILSYIYRDSMNKHDTSIYILLLTLLLVLLYYLIVKHSISLKKNADYAFIQNSINMTMTHVDNIQKEHVEIRKLKHDMKNQLLVLKQLMKEEEYEQAEDYITKLTNEIHDFKSNVISGNLYVDAVLNQKISQYHDIEFDIQARISKDLKIDNKDVVSLLSNIIDNACEELIRIGEQRLKLDICESRNLLMIIETNKCRKDSNLMTDKDEKGHGYGLRIIKEIVDKYEGEVEISITDYFTIEITIIL